MIFHTPILNIQKYVMQNVVYLKHCKSQFLSTFYECINDIRKFILNLFI